MILVMSMCLCSSCLWNKVRTVKHVCKDYLKCNFLNNDKALIKSSGCLHSNSIRKLMCVSYFTIVIPVLICFVLFIAECLHFLLRCFQKNFCLPVCCRSEKVLDPNRDKISDSGSIVDQVSALDQEEVWDQALLPAQEELVVVVPTPHPPPSLPDQPLSPLLPAPAELLDQATGQTPDKSIESFLPIPLDKPHRRIKKTIELSKKNKELLIEGLRNESLESFKSLSEKDLEDSGRDIVWLSRTGVFKHKQIPGLIFRISIESHTIKECKNSEIKAMYDFIEKCWEICEEKNLELVVIPNVGMETLKDIHRERRCILITEELDFEPTQEEQFILRKNLSENPGTALLLEKLEEEIVEFVLTSGYSDVKYDNVPILNRKSEKEPLKAGVIDFNIYTSNLASACLGYMFNYNDYERGTCLVSMIHSEKVLKDLSKKLYEILPKGNNNLDKAFEVNLKSLEIQKKQEEFHKEMNFKTGRELFDLNIIQEEDFQQCLNPLLGFETAKRILGDLNSSLESTKKRAMLLKRQSSIDPYLSATKTSVFKQGYLPANNDELIRGSLFWQVCQILIEKRIIVACEVVCYNVKFWF